MTRGRQRKDIQLSTYDVIRLDFIILLDLDRISNFFLD